MVTLVIRTGAVSTSETLQTTTTAFLQLLIVQRERDRIGYTITIYLQQTHRTIIIRWDVTVPRDMVSDM